MICICSMHLWNTINKRKLCSNTGYIKRFIFLYEALSCQRRESLKTGEPRLVMVFSVLDCTERYKCKERNGHKNGKKFYTGYLGKF